MDTSWLDRLVLVLILHSIGNSKVDCNMYGEALHYEDNPNQSIALVPNQGKPSTT